MRTLHVLAFDAVIEGTTTQFIDPMFNQQLALADKLKLVAVTDTVSGTSPTLAVQLEESGDNRNWVNKSGSAEIPATAISATAVTILAGADNGATPSSGYLRAKLTLGGTSPRARVQLWITGRGEQGGG